MSCHYRALIALLCVFIAIHCRSKYSYDREDNYRSITDTLPTNIQSSLVPLTLIKTGIEVGPHTNTIAITDSFILISSPYSDKNIQVYSRRYNILMAEIIPRGTTIGQCLNVSHIIPISNKQTWLFDVTMQKFLKVDLAKAIRDSSYVAEKEFSLTDSARLFDPCYINDSTFAGTSIFLRNSRYVYINTMGKIIRQVGHLPMPNKVAFDENDGDNMSVLAILNSGLLEKQPLENKMVIAYRYLSRLDFYTNDTLTRILKGPGDFKQDLSYRKEQGLVIPAPTHKTTFGYYITNAIDDLLFAVFSGEKNLKTCGSKIFVLNWSGELIKILDPGREICNYQVVVDGKHYTIYLIDSANGELVYSNLII